MAKDVYVAILALVLGGLMFLGLDATCSLSATQQKAAPKLERVDSADFCTACPELIAELKSNNVETVEMATSVQVNYYPMCRYSDGSVDYGQKVYAKKCNFARPVVIVKYKEKK